MAPSASDDCKDCIGKGGRYRLLKLVAEGSYGTQVWSAIDSFTKEVRAIKVLQRPLDLKYIKREVLIHMELSHQHVVRCFEVFDWGPRLCIVMEYCSNKTLFDFIHERGCLSEPEAQDMAKQIASGLEYLHDQGVVIRDLKLDNILLDAQYRPKICDLGFATSDDFERPNSFLGSLEYFAPELLQLKDEKSVGCSWKFWKRGEIGPYDGKKVDTWTFGVCLYAMLAGQTPFHIPNEPPTASLRRTRSMAYRVPTSTRNNDPISQSCQELIAWILDDDPRRRPSINDILGHEWMKEREGSGVNRRGGSVRRLTRSESDATVKALKRAAGLRRFLPW